MLRRSKQRDFVLRTAKRTRSRVCEVEFASRRDRLASLRHRRQRLKRTPELTRLASATAVGAFRARGAPTVSVTKLVTSLRRCRRGYTANLDERAETMSSVRCRSASPLATARGSSARRSETFSDQCEDDVEGRGSTALPPRFGSRSSRMPLGVHGCASSRSKRKLWARRRFRQGVQAATGTYCWLLSDDD